MMLRVLLLLLALAQPAMAQPARQQPSRAPDTPQADRRALTLPLGQGQVVRFDRPATGVYVGDATIADVEVISPTAVWVFGKAVGRTNLIALGADEGSSITIALRIARGAEAAAGALGALGSRPPVRFDFMENRVVPRGRVGSVEEARDADTAAREGSPSGSVPANRTTFAGSNQIMLRVRFAEVSRNDLFRLGVNWNNFLASGNFLFGFATGGFIPGAVGAAGESFGQGRARFSDGNSVAEGLIDALRREGIVTVLAEPNLTAVSGETASFLAGGELPIPVPQSDRIVTVQFKPFGVSLAFTPTLLPGNRIGLRVRPEVSTLAPSGGTLANGFFVPALTVRRAETTVELASGQTMAIAGLFQRNLTDGTDAIPGLGDMPILGQLFRSQRYQRDETELVIMITPILVRPVSDQRTLRTPLDPPLAPPPPRVAGTAAGFILR